MSGRDPRGTFLYNLPSSVIWEFCRVMDGLSDLDWTRFASEVLSDQNAVRLAERRERRTDSVMNQLENRNCCVGELCDVLERLQLLRPRDVILRGASSLEVSPPPLLPPAPRPVSVSHFDPPPKQPHTLPSQSTCKLSSTGGGGGGGGAAAAAATPPPPPVATPLPRPAPPPSRLQTCNKHTAQPSRIVLGVMSWTYEEVHAGTGGFSPLQQVGEGGFGVVYRAKLNNMDCAVKRLKQDCLLDWKLVKESFQTEVEKLTKFRHPNIVELFGFSEGQGSVCLIYSYMVNRSLEDQLHNEAAALSWPRRISVVEGASNALQFLHSPPAGDPPLIHGDVKSSNILLDQHQVAKLADFGLARFAPRGLSGHTASHTVSVGKTATVRGTLAYLPGEYVREGKLGPAVDVYSFGVVLLEVLTGRRALEKDGKSGERYLKDLVDEVEDSPAGSCAEAWRTKLDRRLITGGAAEPTGCMEMVAVACRCLEKNRRKRPTMAEVFNKLQDLHESVQKVSSCSPLHQPPHLHSQPLSQQSHLHSSVAARPQPLEDTYHPSQSSSSSSSSSSLTPPHPLQSSSSLPLTSSSLPPSSFAGPCETDESRGFSQYNLCSQFRSNGTSSRSLSPFSRDRNHSQPGGVNSHLSEPSVPTEDQYNFPSQLSNTSERCDSGTLRGAAAGPDPGGAEAGLCRAQESLSPASSLRSLSLEPSVVMNPSKQRFLQKKTLYDEGRIQTPELLSSEDLYRGSSSKELRGPEESDELDYIPAKHH